MAKAKQIPKRVAAVLANLRQGKKLCKSLRMKESGVTEVIYAYEPGNGRPLGVKTIELCIKDGHIVPAGDGLFGDETSQTWTLP